MEVGQCKRRSTAWGPFAATWPADQSPTGVGVHRSVGVMPRRVLTASVVLALVAERGSICWLCERAIERERGSGDHVQPVTYGKTNDLTNLRPAHLSCNRQRGEWCVPAYYAWTLAT